MGRQLQLATTHQDDMELLRFIRSLVPVRVFQSFAPSIDELWVEDWESREILPAVLYIWPLTFPWSPEYGQTGGPKCPPESVGQFYVANARTAPVLEFSKSFLEKRRHGRIYWGRDFAAPYGLTYDEIAFAKFTDSVWRWIRKAGRKLPNDKKYSPYFLPDAWSRFGEIAPSG